MTLSTQDLTQTRRWLSQAQREGVSRIITASFSGVAPEAYLQKYFDGPDAFERKLRLYFDGPDLVGYCLLTFSDEEEVTVIRASAGFLPAYRNGGNTFAFSLWESVKGWLRRPWRRIYYADTMLSPAMYRAMARRTGIIWPHPEHSGSRELFERFNPGGEISETTGLRCLVQVGRASHYTQEELASLAASDKPDIQYYRTLNPGFNQGMALFVIIPVHLGQLIRTLLKQLRVR
ncbi:hypothetical protein [Aeromonas schubertii]|nr:hypothetical protein [Aeromonas schubertii]